MHRHRYGMTNFTHTGELTSHTASSRSVHPSHMRDALASKFVAIPNVDRLGAKSMRNVG